MAALGNFASDAKKPIKMDVKRALQPAVCSIPFARMVALRGVVMHKLSATILGAFLCVVSVASEVRAEGVIAIPVPPTQPNAFITPNGPNTISPNTISITGQFDLSSRLHSQNAVNLPHPVNIVVGGRALQVTPTTSLTPAEVVAVDQILNHHHQTLLINGAGAATKGWFNIGTDLPSACNSISIPKHVTAFDNIANVPSLDFSQGFTNNGRLVLYSANPKDESFTVKAPSIVNNGVISETAPVLLPYVRREPGDVRGIYFVADILVQGRIGSPQHIGTLTGSGPYSPPPLPPPQPPPTFLFPITVDWLIPPDSINLQMPAN